MIILPNKFLIFFSVLKKKIDFSKNIFNTQNGGVYHFPRARSVFLQFFICILGWEYTRVRAQAETTQLVMGILLINIESIDMKTKISINIDKGNVMKKSKFKKLHNSILHDGSGKYAITIAFGNRVTF